MSAFDPSAAYHFRRRRPFGATRVQPSGKGKCQANYGDQRYDDRNNKERNSVEQRGQPEGRVSLPEGRARAVKCLRAVGERGKSFGCSAGNWPEQLQKRSGRPVDLPHRFQQQILQGGMEIPLAQSNRLREAKGVNVRTGSVAAEADEAAPQNDMLQPRDRFGDGLSLPDAHQ